MKQVPDLSPFTWLHWQPILIIHYPALLLLILEQALGDALKSTDGFYSTMHNPTQSSVVLTHWGRVTHICVSKLTIIGSDNGLSPGRLPSHYLNQCWDIVHWTLRNKLKWNFNGHSCIFIQENALKNGVCEMASVLSRPQCVKNVPFAMWVHSHSRSYNGEN